MRKEDTVQMLKCEHWIGDWDIYFGIFRQSATGILNISIYQRPVGEETNNNNKSPRNSQG